MNLKQKNIRGRGSMKNKSEEDAKRSKPGYEHLNEDLHVIIETDPNDVKNKKKTVVDGSKSRLVIKN